MALPTPPPPLPQTQMPGDPAAQAASTPAPGAPVEATPEEQDQYDHFVAKAYELTYDQGTFKQILQMLKAGDPIEAVSRVASMVIKRVIDAAQSGGIELADDVTLHAATEVFEDIANIATKAKIHDFEKDLDGLEAAYLRTINALRMILQSSGQIDEAAAQKDFEALVQMDKAGELEAVFRSLAGTGEGGAAPPPDMEPEPEEGPEMEEEPAPEDEEEF